MQQGRTRAKLALRVGTGIVLIAMVGIAMSGTPRDRLGGDGRRSDQSVGRLPANPRATPTVATRGAPDETALEPTATVTPSAPATVAPGTPCLDDACDHEQYRAPAAVEPTAVVPAPIADLTAMRNRRRALITYEALWKYFYVADDALFLERHNYDGWPPFAYVWPLSQVLGLTSDMAALDDTNDRYRLDQGTVLAVLERYWDTTGAVAAYSSYLQPDESARRQPGLVSDAGDRYYDDNVWLGLAMLRAYEVTGDPLVLQRARQIFDYMVSGWDTNPASPSPGGIYWVESGWSQNRNTVSTAPAAELGLRLYALTDDPDARRYYFDWSTRIYDWMMTTLQAEDGLFFDHIKADGTVDRAPYPYNQGAMIGANVMFYRVTGDATYLDRAEHIATAALRLFGGDELRRHSVAFNTLFARALLDLHALRPNLAYPAFLQRYADQMWQEARDRQTGLFTTSTPLTLLDQAAMGELYAMLAGYGLGSRER